jgi:hypothetical protein
VNSFYGEFIYDAGVQYRYPSLFINLGSGLGYAQVFSAAPGIITYRWYESGSSMGGSIGAYYVSTVGTFAALAVLSLTVAALGAF